MPTYLVAIDFSEASRRVVDLASQWAKADGADVVLVHAFSRGFQLGMVYDDGPVDPLTQVQQELKLDEAVQITTKWAEKLRKQDIDVTTVAREADADRLILELSDEHKVDVIFVGRRGHNAVREFFLGSTADAVVRRATVPVVVVPEPDE